MAICGERKQRGFLAIIVVIGLCTGMYSPAMGGLIITRNFISAGNTIPNIGVTAGAAPGSAVGGGDLESIFNAAADLWEAAINDTFTTTISFGWVPLSGSTAALTDNTNFDNLTSAIRFDNDSSFAWFLDPTPTESSEWDSFTQQSTNLGAGVVITSRQKASPTGNAVGKIDLFTAALHEIGHALGFTLSISAFGTEIGDGDIDVVSPLPFPGSTIPVAAGDHVALSGSVLQSSLISGSRSFMSEADILGVAQVGGFTNVNLNPLSGTGHVPEPSSLLLVLIGSIMMLPNKHFRGRRSVSSC